MSPPYKVNESPVLKPINAPQYIKITKSTITVIIKSIQGATAYLHFCKLIWMTPNRKRRSKRLCLNCGAQRFYTSV